MLRVWVRASVHPSEDARLVERAVTNLFGAVEIETSSAGLVASTDTLAPFAKHLHRQRILDAARGVFLHGVAEGGSVARFVVSKQAAAAGHVSFAVGQAPLGDLEVEVQAPDLSDRLRAVAPRTVRGVPISEEEAARIEARERQLREARKAAGQELLPDEGDE